MADYGRAEALALFSHDLLARIAAELLERALVEPTECRYCGIRPGQEMPRSSYYEMRTRLAEAERLLAVPMSEMDTAYGAECDAFLSASVTLRSESTDG
jgi:hypothetical protein